MGHIDVVKFLLEKGVDKNIKNNDGHTALSRASERGQMSVVNVLQASLEKDILSHHHQLLVSAAQKGDTDTVKKTIDLDANLVKTSGNTALLEAATKGHINVVQLLLEKGVNKETKDIFQMTPLHVASHEGRIDVVEFLLDKGANIEAKDYNSDTALHLAASRGHAGIVRLLLEKGANKEAINRNGLTAFFLAKEGGHIETIHVLRSFSKNREEIKDLSKEEVKKIKKELFYFNRMFSPQQPASNSLENSTEQNNKDKERYFSLSKNF